METAGEIIRDTFQELLVQAAEQPMRSVDTSTAIRYMNRMFDGWRGLNIELGYNRVSNLADPVTIPDACVEGVVFNLALKLATSYDIPVTQGLAQNAREGMKVIRKLGLTYKAPNFPSTLPIGSGNEDFYTDAFSEHFYNTEQVPSDALDLKTEEQENFLVDFTYYLAVGETIASYELDEQQAVRVIDSVNQSTAIALTVLGVTPRLGYVCIKITTSTGRIMPQQVYFDITEGCRASTRNTYF